MGNQAKGKEEDEAWTLVRGNGEGAIYRDKEGRLAERHRVTVDPRYPRDVEMGIYSYRKDAASPIVHTYKTNEQKSTRMCGGSPDIDVLQEYICNRLSATRDLSHEQGLYVLAAALQGFHQLCYRVHPFSVTDQLIAFNQNGEVRVWHCPDFASNHNQYDPILLRSVQTPTQAKNNTYNKEVERELVQEVWDAVKKHSHFDPSFERDVNQLQDCDFQDARVKVASQIFSKKWAVPDTLPFRDNVALSQKAY